MEVKKLSLIRTKIKGKIASTSACYWKCFQTRLPPQLDFLSIFCIAAHLRGCFYVKFLVSSFLPFKIAAKKAVTSIDSIVAQTYFHKTEASKSILSILSSFPQLKKIGLWYRTINDSFLCVPYIRLKNQNEKSRILKITIVESS